MALSRDMAAELWQTVLDGSYAGRMVQKANAGLDMLYAYSTNQWAHVSNRDGGQQLNQLRPILNPSDPNVRISINGIRHRVRELNARSKPQKIEYTTEPSSSALNDRLAARVGKRRLEIYSAELAAVHEDVFLRAFRRAFIMRTVLGSSIVRRVLIPRGNPVVLRDPMGEPQTRRDGSVRYLQSYGHELRIVPPYNMIRDPSATSPDFEGEPAIGQESPISVPDLERRFGNRIGARIKTKSVLGDFFQMQELVNKAIGLNQGGQPTDSKLPAVMMGEVCFRDASEASGWPLYMLYWRDVAPDDSDGADGKSIHILQFGRNPYVSLPWHHFVHDELTMHGWGMGVPRQLKLPQDLENIVRTRLLRIIVNQSGSGWVVEDNAFDDDIETILSRRDTKVLKAKMTHNPKHWPPITRLDPSPLDPNLMSTLHDSPTVMDRAAGLSDVGRGVTSKRGDAVGTVELAIEQADQVFDDRMVDDQAITNAVLTGTLHDLQKIDGTARGWKALKGMMGGEFADAELGAYVAQDVFHAGIGVRVTRDSLRPHTERQMRNAYTEAINSRMIEGPAARLAILDRTGIALDPLEGEAFWQQKTEIGLLLQDVPVEVEEGHLHPVHLYVLKKYQNGPQWLILGEEQKDRIRQHVEEHMAYTEAELAIEADLGGQPQNTAGPEGSEMMVEPAGMTGGPGSFAPTDPATMPAQGMEAAMAGAPGAGPVLSMTG